jgi:hypothetical protein
VSVSDCDRARRVLLRPQQRHFSTGCSGVLEPFREQRLGSAVRSMTGCKQQTCRVEVMFSKGANLEPSHGATIAPNVPTRAVTEPDSFSEPDSRVPSEGSAKSKLVNLVRLRRTRFIGVFGESLGAGQAVVGKRVVVTGLSDVDVAEHA